MQPGDQFEVEISELGADGRGHGVAHGREIRVFDLLPGESGLVVIEHLSQHEPVAWARLAERCGPPSSARVTPPCPVFGRCGGCTWQHLAYPAQLDAKQAAVTSALGGVATPDQVDEVIPATREMRYRNFGKYVVAQGSLGEVTLGAYLPRSHEVVSTLGCTVLEPTIDETARRIAEVLSGARVAVYNEQDRRGCLRYVLIRANFRGQLLIGLVTTSKTPQAAMRGIARQLMSRDVCGIVWIKNDSTGGTLLTNDREVLEGADRICERLGRVEVELATGAFFQINREQAERIYEWTARAAGPPGTAVDVYCGVGGIALTLAAHGWKVVGLERDRDAVRAATAASSRQRLSARFQCGDARELASLAGDAELLVVNPPRTGLQPDTRAAIAGLGPRQLIYVSCNPSTLARDLADLGAKVESVAPFDLLPGTAHIETVVKAQLE